MPSRGRGEGVSEINLELGLVFFDIKVLFEPILFLKLKSIVSFLFSVMYIQYFIYVYLINMF